LLQLWVKREQSNLEEFEHAMAKALTMSARTYRSIWVTMYGMHMAKAAIEREAKKQSASKRAMQSELAQLLDLLEN